MTDNAKDSQRISFLKMSGNPAIDLTNYHSRSNESSTATTFAAGQF